MKILQSQKWIPAFLVMATIFYFSSRGSNDLPNFGLMDTILKKGGHVLGYTLLSLSMNYWFDGKRVKSGAWSVFYAISDEFHQSFTKGRHPSFVDVFVFDLIGIMIGIVFYDQFAEFIRTRARTLRR